MNEEQTKSSCAMTFIDGPAAGVSLMFERTPIALRVVRDAAGQWDVLNELTDTPKPDEKIFVYVLKEITGSMHISRRGAKGGRQGGWSRIGSYIYLPVQPEDSEARDTKRWQAWTLLHQTEIEARAGVKATAE